MMADQWEWWLFAFPCAGIMYLSIQLSQVIRGLEQANRVKKYVTNP
jgi:hypothetical protein